MACPACDSSERTRIAPGFFRCDANVKHLSNGPDGVEVWYSKCGREYQDSDPGTAGGTGVLCNCGCGLYAVGECTRCGQGFSGDHRGSIGGAFVCLGCFEQHREQVAQHDRDARGTAQRGQSFEEAARVRRDVEAQKAQEAQREQEARQRVDDEFRAKSRAYRDNLVAWAGELAGRLVHAGAVPDRRLVHRTERQETTHGFFRSRTRTVAGPTEHCNGWIVREHSWSKSSYHEDRGSTTIDQGRCGVLVAESGQLVNYRVSTHRLPGPVLPGQASEQLLDGQWRKLTFREQHQDRFISLEAVKQEQYSCVWWVETPLNQEFFYMGDLEPALTDLAIRMDLL